MTGSVRVDTSDLDRGVRQLIKGLEDGSPDGARTAAQRTASAIRAATPIRTGRLRATVSVVTVGDGFGVAAGGSLRYARPVMAHSRAVARGIAGQPAAFGRAMRALAEKEVNRL